MTVGFASAFGLAWLGERTAGRPVGLLIGDIRKGFSTCTEADRLAAIRFIQRKDVSVRNWYRKRGGYQVAHAKAAASVAAGLVLLLMLPFLLGQCEGMGNPESGSIAGSAVLADQGLGVS